MPGPLRRVTVTSDLGPVYGAQLLAVLYRALSPARIVPLTQELPAHGIVEAAFVWDAMVRQFPPGTVHLIVVDPGVGGRRAPVAVTTEDGSVLVGPDNGLLDRLALRLGVRSAVRLDPRRLGATSRVGATFDGRDLFAPAAVALARGRAPGRLGEPYAFRPTRPPPPRRTPRGGLGRIVHLDRFGNLITDLPSSWIPAGAGRVRLLGPAGKARTVPFVTHYERLRPAQLGVLPSSFGTLEIGCREASAAARLALGVGGRVAVVAVPGRRSPRAARRPRPAKGK